MYSNYLYFGNWRIISIYIQHWGSRQEGLIDGWVADLVAGDMVCQQHLVGEQGHLLHVQGGVALQGAGAPHVQQAQVPRLLHISLQ